MAVSETRSVHALPPTMRAQLHQPAVALHARAVPRDARSSTCDSQVTRGYVGLQWPRRRKRCGGAGWGQPSACQMVGLLPWMTPPPATCHR